MIAPSINEYAAAPKMFPEGTTSVAWIQSDSPGGQFALTLLEPEIPEAVTLTKIFASTETVDWAPYCLQARDAGATVVGIGLSGPATAAAMRACKQQGLTDVTYVVPGLAAGDAFLDSVEPDDNVIVVAGFGGDGLAEYTAELERYADEAGHDVDLYQDQTIAAWLSVRVAADALSKADEISGAAVKRYLDAQTAYETGATGPLDFTTPSPGRAPRIVNRATYKTTVEDGKLVLLSDEPVYAG
jgi:ABC-type branched-subunit amino acid transport system substrate-binding protein